ncbi:hypothetical protein POM88_013772 [Heracleum sosnowskyi]|uniref:Uncharacterized protein n=1 Tax=Heracleum sosnowskyi TaxID=360622 RepID=A0AAD8IZS9_9APIA|nr:hypothetical protein POM88_013772 [Heracleum sosnowskyi]
MASSSQNPSQTPATAISPTTTEQLSFEFSQMSIEIGNWRASVQQYLQDQYLQTITNINIERSSHDTLVLNFVRRLVTIINQKEHELATALNANSVLHRRLADCEATVANLNQQLEMMQRRQEMMEANVHPVVRRLMCKKVLWRFLPRR